MSYCIFLDGGIRWDLGEKGNLRKSKSCRWQWSWRRERPSKSRHHQKRLHWSSFYRSSDERKCQREHDRRCGACGSFPCNRYDRGTGQRCPIMASKRSATTLHWALKAAFPARLSTSTSAKEPNFFCASGNSLNILKSDDVRFCQLVPIWQLIPIFQMARSDAERCVRWPTLNEVKFLGLHYINRIV